MRYLFIVAFLISSILSNAQLMKVSSTFNQVIDMHQKAIFLSQNRTDFSNLSDYEFSTVGLQIMHRKQKYIDELLELIIVDTNNLEIFLTFLEDTSDLWDVDKLAFFDLILELSSHESLNNAQLKRIIEDQNALRQIQKIYNKEMLEVFSIINTRSMIVRRKMWNEYINFLSKKYTVEKLMSEYPNLKISESNTRGKSDAIWGYELPAKTLVFTFDDGPHYKITPQILKIFKEKNTPAIFFNLGNNMATFSDDGTYKERSGSKYSKEIANEALFLIGNHTLSHPLLTKVDSTEKYNEIIGGFELIDSISNSNTTLFRPPYGGYNKEVLSILKLKESKPFLWNIDSRDWADPVPASIAKRVIDQAIIENKGVILLHDIHQKTVESIEMIIDTLLLKGFTFALWDGNTLIKTEPNENLTSRSYLKSKNTETETDFYSNHWAVVIGINKYEHWPKLDFAVNDAEGIADVLETKLNFKKENIVVITDEDATRENIIKTLGEKLISNPDISSKDAVFIFYAGHGMTRMVNDKKSIGYIVPVETNPNIYNCQAISMSEISDINELIPAQHVFWVMDACYSGLALTRAGNSSSIDLNRYYKEVINRKGRQIITAGGMNEEVADGGPNGHSIFTWSLINALSGDADVNGDGFITASEIFNYVPPNVSSISQQTPAFGNMIGSSGGDFIFQLQQNSNELSENTEQHDEATSALLTQISLLKEQLANMQNQLVNNRNSNEIKNENEISNEQLSVNELNSLGLQAYRQKNYEYALECFHNAIKIDSTSIQPINNLGFVYYKTGEYNEALKWILYALKLSPNRLVAYLNLADVQLALGDKNNAIINYEKYISLSKANDFTEELKIKVQELKTN